MISDILETANTLALESFLVTIDIEKTLFESVNHCFVLQILQKFEFVIDCVSWIKVILKNQEFCIITEEKQLNISNQKKVLNRKMRYQRICLYLFRKYCLYLLKITLRLKA